MSGDDVDGDDGGSNGEGEVRWKGYKNARRSSFFQLAVTKITANL